MSTLENEETTEAYPGRVLYLNIQNVVPPRNFLKISFFFRRRIANIFQKLRGGTPVMRLITVRFSSHGSD